MLDFSVGYAESIAPAGLNSERIRARYGSYGVEVIAASESLRISSLYSMNPLAEGGSNRDQPGNSQDDTDESSVATTGAAGADPANPERTTRTLAIVRFQLPMSEALAAVHRQIVAGASIGESFLAAGWVISKDLMLLCELTLSAGDLPGIDTMGIQLPALLALHRYRFAVQRAGVKIAYAVIEEIHHPDYLDLAALQQIYQGTPAFSLSANKLTACSISL